MKKHILLLGFAALLCSTQSSFARNPNPIAVKCFEAEGTTVYNVRGCVPGSDISFYSTQGGGVMLKQATVNTAGNANISWGQQKAAPAFVLNVLDKNASGIAGSGMVAFTTDKEFIINDLALDNNSGNAILRWNGAVTVPENYTFEILKSVNGSDYTVVQTLNAQSSAVMPYSFTDLSLSGTATYQVRVVSSGKEVYYTSNPLFANGQDGISVYPTVVNSNINVRLNNATSSSYRILSMNGQVISSGTLNNVQNNLSVAGLSSGNYLIEVSTSSNKAVTKFEKKKKKKKKKK